MLKILNALEPGLNVFNLEGRGIARITQASLVITPTHPLSFVHLRGSLTPN